MIEGMIMHMIDIVLLVLYCTVITCSGYIILCHKTYFHERFQKGIVSIFMLAMLFFLIAYTFKMLIVLLLHSMSLLGMYYSPELNIWLKYSWTLAQFGTTIGIIALAILTHTGKYDKFIHLRVIHREGGGYPDPDSDKK